jgi:selenocysteine-specific elongation factor
MSPTPSSDSRPRSRSLIIATAGHVDHGKSSLVRHITGVDTDTLAEEKTRGLSINLGFAYYHFKTSGQLSTTDGKTTDKDSTINNTIGFVDVPGHTDFINNMLAGVSTVDVAILVIAADDGIMPQTREHLAILDLLGINRGVIVLTKIDRCDTDQIQRVTRSTEELIQDTRLHGSPVFQVSNSNKQGIPELVSHLESMLSEEKANPNDSEDHNLQDSYFRYLIDRSFTAKGIGTVVTGSVRAGSIHVGGALMHTPGNQLIKLKGLKLDREDRDSVSVGQRASAHIGLSKHDVARGDWLIDPALNQSVLRLDVKLRLLGSDPMSVRSNTQYHLYLNASHHVINIRHLGDTDSDWFQIKSNERMIAHYGDRFILRDPASQHTIGGGKVVDIFVPRRGRDSEERLAALNALDKPLDEALLELMALQAGGVDLTQFSVARNCTEHRIEQALEKLKIAGEVFALLKIDKQELPHLLHDKFYQQHSQQILDSIKQYHVDHRTQQGISEPALTRAVKFAGSHLLFHSILQKLIEQGEIKRTGTLLHSPGHQTQLSTEEKAFLEKVRPILLKADFVPPRTRELEELTGIQLKTLENILKQTRLAGNLIQVAPNRHYLPETIMKLAGFTEKLAQESNSDEGFSVIQFRDTSAIGRNLCIEILEYFDTIGFTRRDGNSRFLRTDKENIFGN